jgi:hypothetical protein
MANHDILTLADFMRGEVALVSECGRLEPHCPLLDPSRFSLEKESILDSGTTDASAPD